MQVNDWTLVFEGTSAGVLLLILLTIWFKGR